MDRNGTSRNEQSARFWHRAVAMLGLIWNLVLPIVGGVLFGSYLDKRMGHGGAWTMGLLAVGVAISLYNLYHILLDQVQH